MQPTVIQVTTTPGTPKQVSTTHIGCQLLWVTNLSAHIVSFGNKDLDTATGAGVIANIPALASGATPDSNIIKLQYCANPYDVSEFYVDSATAAIVNIIPFLP